MGATHELAGSGFGGQVNGISPFNYRKLTPEQEKRGERIAVITSYAVIVVVVALVIWTIISR